MVSALFKNGRETAKKADNVFFPSGLQTNRFFVHLAAKTIFSEELFEALSDYGHGFNKITKLFKEINGTSEIPRDTSKSIFMSDKKRGAREQ